MLKKFLQGKASRAIANAMKLKDGERIIPVEVYRYRGGSSKPYTETFMVDTKDTPMILDVLLKIKNTMDPTLTLRRSCREGICGSCAMNIGGTNTLACLCTLEEAITPDGKIRVYPLPHQHPIKDLVPDMNRFYQHHASVEPWLHLTPEQEQSKTENLQSIEDREKLDGLYECVLCACCSTSCPSYWWHGKDNYLGPAILLQAFRWISDSRDVATQYRLQQLGADKEKVFQCHQILSCTLACPKNLNPARAAGYLKEMVTAQMEAEGSDITLPYTSPKAFNNAHASEIHKTKLKEGLMAKAETH
mmetsp:Transcript_17118/g.29180  ORF Transcript_17118/g.29180 Transcript_17118/m.29180 type:complete len:304 (+) Transcript_17118:24-935(+)